MEFPFGLSFLNTNDDHDVHNICVIDGSFARSLSSEHYKTYTHVIDEMGKASCKAQGLSHAVTASHLLMGSDHVIYVMHDGQQTAKGILKIGFKKLFIHDLQRQYVEMRPLCVLDFYVHEKCQRMGIGRCLFEFMLTHRSSEPRLLAYDAPSAKLLGFLKKHYSLKAFLPQNCNYVVFDDYFCPTREYHFEPSKAEVHIQTEIKEVNDLDAYVTADEPSVNVQEELSVDEEERKVSPAEEQDEPQAQADHEQNALEQPKDDAFENQSHQSQMAFIEKQIAQTKLELKASDANIHRHYFEEVSPFSESHPMKRAYDMRFRRKKSGFY